MKKLVYLFCFILIVISCKKKNKFTPVCDGSSPTYNSFVNSVISTNCLNCHGPGSSNGDFSTYAKLTVVLNNGAFVDAVLKEQSMPENGSLSEETLNKLQCWTDNGFPEN